METTWTGNDGMTESMRLCMVVIIGYYPPTREVSYLLRETRGREAPEGESSKYDTSRGRRVVTHLSPNKRSKIHGENRCIFLKIFSVLQSSPVCLRYSESAIYGEKNTRKCRKKGSKSSCFQF